MEIKVPQYAPVEGRLTFLSMRMHYKQLTFEGTGALGLAENYYSYVHPAHMHADASEYILRLCEMFLDKS